MKNILEEANKIVANVEEDIGIEEILQERSKKDNGKRYTLEEAWAEINKKSK
jgi:hypothetical protein